MPDVRLVLSIPQGAITATSLGIEGFARHRSPGSGKHFKGRNLLVDLGLENGRPAFDYLEEGGWRDARGDTLRALEAAAGGKRTKTALSNNAFSCTPVTAYRSVFLVKTGGEVMEMAGARKLHEFKSHVCHEEMSPSEVAAAAGSPDNLQRRPHLYMVMCPIQLLLLSNLTPVEYAWYATHRPGKVFRQVVFTEIETDQLQLAAESRYRDARLELEASPDKKTKTIVGDDCINEIPFHAWLGYDRREDGGIYSADRDHTDLWPFPAEIPGLWEHAIG